MRQCLARSVWNARKSHLASTKCNRPPSWWGGGWLPFPKNPTPLSAFQASGFGPLGLASPRPEFSNLLRSKTLHTALNGKEMKRKNVGEMMGGKEGREGNAEEKWMLKKLVGGGIACGKADSMISLSVVAKQWPVVAVKLEASKSAELFADNSLSVVQRVPRHRISSMSPRTCLSNIHTDI